MSILDAPPESAAAQPSLRRPRTTLLLLRIVVALHAVAVIAQPVLIGQYLDGDFDTLALHATNANIVFGLCFVQLVVAVLYWRPGGGRGWPALVTAVLFLAEGGQVGVGYARELGIHIPLGVLIVSTTVVLTVWVFRSGARQPRPSRRVRRDEGSGA